MSIEHDLEALALRLTRSERARLARRLIDSLDEGEAEVSQSWAEEAVQRDEDIRLGRAAPLPIDEVLSDARSTPGGPVPQGIHAYVPGQRVLLSGSVMLGRSEYELESVPATVARVESSGIGFLPDADATQDSLIEHLNAVEEGEGLLWWNPNVDGGSMMHVTQAPLLG